MREFLASDLSFADERAPLFLGAARRIRFAAGAPVLFGAGYDGTTSFRPGARFAPDAIRQVSDGLETYSPALDRDLDDIQVLDAGNLDLPFGAPAPAVARVEAAVAEVLASGLRPFMLGGEHSLTAGAVQAAARVFPDLCIIQLDAHADLRPEYLGEAYSHASAMRRCLDAIGAPGTAPRRENEVPGTSKNTAPGTAPRRENEVPGTSKNTAPGTAPRRENEVPGTSRNTAPGTSKTCSRLLQVGIRSGTREEFREMRAAGRLVAPRADLLAERVAAWGSRPVYLSVDLDIFDPAYLPGTGTPEPGGIDWSSFEALLSALAELRIVGCDVMELAPQLDPSGASSVLASKVVRELLLSFF